MSVAPLTSLSSAPVMQEPTHRFGRALDDRLPLSPNYSQSVPAAGNNRAETTTASVSGNGSADEDALSFDDILDMVNPLQHLPVVSTLYRKWTGDEISPAAKVVGGGLFGGIAGVASALIDVAVESFSGDDIGGHVMTALFGDDNAAPDEGENATVIAANGQNDSAAASSASPAASAAQAAAARSARAVSGPAGSLLADPASAKTPDARHANVSPPAPAAAPTPKAMADFFESPAVPNLSAGAFENLMQGFGTQESGGRPTSAAPALAYAPPARAGQVLDLAL